MSPNSKPFTLSPTTTGGKNVVPFELLLEILFCNPYPVMSLIVTSYNELYRHEPPISNPDTHSEFDVELA